MPDDKQKESGGAAVADRPEQKSANPAPPPKQDEKEEKKAPRRRVVPFVIGGLLLAAAAGFLIWLAIRPPAVPENVVAVTGRVEGDESAISAKVSGRILAMTVREGDEVRAGQVLATLDDQQIRAREMAAMAALTQAEARVRLARQQISVMNEQLRESQLGVGQSRQEAEGRVREAEAQLASAEAQLAERQASLELAQYDRDAYTRLAKTGAASERQAREAVTTAESRAATVASAKRQVEAARGALNAAQAGLTNPAIRTAQSGVIQQQIIQQQAEIASAQAEADQARAQLDEARANREDLRIKAPFDGTIATRTAEPGEVVNAGTSIATMLDLSKVYLRAYVPEGQIGRVRVGQPGRVYLDSAPDRPLEAVVSRIDPQAAFTPENTYFREDRVKQVVGIKLQLKTGFGYAKPGMPADGEVLVEGTSWPERRRRK